MDDCNPKKKKTMTGEIKNDKQNNYHFKQKRTR